jgi:hypothetical protein
MKRALLLSAFVLLGSAGAAAAQAAPRTPANADVVGKWEFTIVGPQGPNVVTMTFARTDGALTGTGQSEMGSFNLVDVMVAQNDLSFALRFEQNGQTFDIPFKGKVTGAAAEGSATINMGDAPQAMAWTAKKLPPG